MKKNFTVNNALYDSVLSDLPSVVSDSYIAFLDPQETYFGAGESGRRYNLCDPLLSQYRDQFSPYEDVLGCKISSGYLKGTLFRLPLRKWPSKISIKPYTSSKIHSLFESFMEEAPIILLFLKNVEKIAIYETSWNEHEKILFTVQIKEDLRAAIKEMKRKFIDIATNSPDTPYEISYEIISEMRKTGKQKEEFKFMVLNRVGTESDRLVELSSSLRMLPWVGVAAPLDQTTDGNTASGGRVFCFLPLPANAECKTGLAAHIHGAFGLTDNRRQVKWPGAERESDDAAEWNVLLIREVVSKAYASLILTLTQSQYTSEELQPLVHNIWPNVDRVQDQWKLILHPLFKCLADKAVLWTPSQGGRWISLEDGILNRLECSPVRVRKEVCEVVLEFLLQANEPVIVLPRHVVKSVTDYLQRYVKNVKEVTPNYVRDVLKGKSPKKSTSDSNNNNYAFYERVRSYSKTCPNKFATGGLNIYNLSGSHSVDVTSLERKEKLCLLEFIVMDEKFEELEGIPLLPLADKTFTKFRSDVHGYSKKDSVLIASRCHPRSLIPGGEDKFLDEQIERSLFDTLSSVAETADGRLPGITQLLKLSPSLVPRLIQDNMPAAWKGSSLVVPWSPKEKSYPDDVWLRGLWSWLKAEFPNDLTAVEDIPLLPTAEGRSEGRHLVKLRKDNVVILGSSYFASLPRNVVNALQNSGCIVLPHLPPFCDHPSLRQYIEPPTPPGVIRVLASVIDQPGNNQLVTSSAEDKIAIRAFLSSLRNPSDDEIVTLMALPIFQAIDGSTFTAVQPAGPLSGAKLDVGPPRLHLPPSTRIQFSHRILSAADDDSHQLLRRLPVRILNTSDFFIYKILPCIERGDFYTRDEVSKLMFWVLHRLPALSSDNRSFLEHIKDVRFIPTAGGSLKAPCELYDPEDEVIQKLFEEEPGMFPAEEFSRAHTLSLLRVFLGLRRSRSLEGKDILLIAQQITRSPEESALRRAEALLQVLTDNSHLVQSEVTLGEGTETSKKATVGNLLSSLPWLPASREPPNKYPTAMPWFGTSRRFHSPKDTRDAEMANIVGSSMPVLLVCLNDKLKTAFGWSFPPPISHVVAQLKASISTWNNQLQKSSSDFEILKFRAMLKDIYSHLSSNMVIAEAALVLKEQSFLPWVWHGSGFEKPNSVAFYNSCLLNLKPYVHVISEDFQKYNELFKRCGVMDTIQETTALEVLKMIRDWHLEEIRHFDDVKRDLRLSQEILEFLTRDETPLPMELRSTVLVPVQTSNGRLVFETCDKVSFCDADWLAQGNMGKEMVDMTFSMHKSISNSTAQLLGIPPLSRNLAVAETFGFQQIGEYEPVTTRVKSILNNYNDDMAVFEELIKNADDAGATEIKFLFDWRRNRSEKLLSPGMAETQGPALWAYNDSVFTDHDFANIDKLAGATNMGNQEKLGRFGIGFCSVYNITDLPSFISREYIAFFDPHTTHLEDLIKDKSRPGIRINLKNNARALTVFPDQFQPYHGIFGCSVAKQEEPFHYDGTLFRFPLRTIKQANESEICNKYHDEEHFISLLSAFQKKSSKMVMFLRNVTKIGFFQLPSDVANPASPEVIFEVEKEILSTLPYRGLSQEHLLTKSTMPVTNDLNGSWVFQQTHQERCASSISKTVRIRSIAYALKSSKVVKMQQEHQVWLITTCYGEGKSLEMANSEDGKLNGLLPRAEVAVMLSENEQENEPLKPVKIIGEAFRGLPLCVDAGLPVHVNAYFAVTMNRRTLWEDTEGGYFSQEPVEVLWNQYLLEDAASMAYVHLLEDIAYLCREDKIAEFPMEAIWPNPNRAPSKIWKTFAGAVYQNAAKSLRPLLRSQSEWAPVKESVFLDEKLNTLPECYEIMCVCGYHVVQLPRFISSAFTENGGPTILNHTFDMDRFLCDVFFPNIDRLPGHLRDPVVCHVLDEYLRGSLKYESLLRRIRCIPTSPVGCTLSRPEELVDPIGPVSCLFLQEESIFPCGEGFLKKERLAALKNLGMADAVLSWKGVCERATFIASLAYDDISKATQMSRNLVTYLKENITKLSPPNSVERRQLCETSFLPVMGKPTGYVLPWQGANDAEKNLLSAKELCREEFVFLLGSVKPILDESSETGCDRLSKDISKLLGFPNRHFTVQDALWQLYTAVQSLAPSDPDSRDCIRKVCFAVYQFLQDKQNTVEKQFIQECLSGRPWIFVENKFVKSSQVAFSWNSHDSLFLCRLPEEFALRFRDLFKALGVGESFSAQDMVDALFVFYERKKGSPLSSEELRSVETSLEDIVAVDEGQLISYFGQLPVPDENLVLTPAGELTINDTPWIQHQDQANCVHGDISWTLAHKLGALTSRERKLAKYSHCIGKPFGQSERLIDRLKSVLESYPCDVGILKEIVQNADDAGATEVHFVHDLRHHGTTRILSERWRDLQGPALCIYNDCLFSEKDMEGIQRLGIGSKMDSPTKMGNHGIYHLTDCPSFISNGETLCVLDPHARYAPNASLESPGRRFSPLDEEFWKDFSDIRSCYLEEFFELKNSTMVRLPLRSDAMAKKSEISPKCCSTADLDHLLTILETEIRDMLVFLRSVTKISISRVENNRFTRRYEATAMVPSSDKPKINAFHAEVKKCQELKTDRIPWFGITCGTTIKDSLGRREEWLIYQCLGFRQHGDLCEIPDGSKHNLLPWASVAACVSTSDSSSRHQSTSAGQQTGLSNKIHRLYCFLPLPTDTGLPVHINGQFILDKSRRNLWKDEDGQDHRTHWNTFVKMHVLGPAYAELIVAAREYIPGIHRRESWYFNHMNDATTGLKWYNSLFPDPQKAHTEWKDFASIVYSLLANSNQPVLPIVRVEEQRSAAILSTHPIPRIYRTTQTSCKWVPPCSEEEAKKAYFSDISKPDLESLLLKVGLPLVNAPLNVYSTFKRAEVKVNIVTPDVTISFLANTGNYAQVLPCSLDSTTIAHVGNLKLLIEFCMRDDKFLQRLDGLPLLLTEDGVLRQFNSSNPVFFTPFSSLVPSQQDQFLHKDFVDVFKTFPRSELWKPGVFKRFDTSSVEPFLIQVFPSKWFACDRHVPWYLNEGDTFSVEWLVMLWEMIQATYRERQSSFEDESNILRPFENWPVIPTTKGTLAPVSLGKTVLDVSPRIYDDDRMVRILCKLGSAEFDFGVLSKLSKDDVLQIVSPYLAKPYSRQDVITVLHYLSKANEFHCDLLQCEIVTLLRFLQEDTTTVFCNQSLLRKLPFYKALDKKLVCLHSYAFAYVVDVPECVPLHEVEKRVERESCVLLEAIHEIEPLYKALDISYLSQVEVFVKYVLPNLDCMSHNGIHAVLTYIRDTLLVTTKSQSERNTLLSALQEANILTGDDRGLYPARMFYDPENPVFKAMLSPDCFPPGEYQQSGWLPFLRQIGMKHTVSQQQYIEFAEALALNAVSTYRHATLREKSKILTTYLFQHEILHEPSFVHIVSSIKFVATEVAADELRSLHPQMGCENKDEFPPFTEFHGAISSEQQKLAWTSVPLLPIWATPNDADRQLLEDLGVARLPPLDKVISHVEALTKTYSGNVHKDTPKDQRELLHDVMYDTFTFLKGECNCSTAELSGKCSKSCLSIGNILMKTPCIPVEEGRVFVEGNQLAFESTIELPPYFYKVPREYGHFEHLLKRLGALEKPTPIQFANVLQRLKEVCEDKHMEPNEKRVARLATHGFFTTLSVQVKEKSEDAAIRCLLPLNELFLPSKEGFLKLSNELIFHDCPSFERRARDFAGDFVDISREGELTADRLSYLLGLLPTRLRAKTIQNLLREEIHPSCRERRCIADSLGEDCPFVKRYRNILLSPKLVNGILRVIRHQRQTPNLPQDVNDQVQVLSSTLDVTCMASLDTHLVHLESGNTLKGSNETQDCFLEEQDGQWQLFIRHGTDENPLHIQLCFLVNRLIHNQIEKEIYLQAMLACRVPDEILPSLDRCGVAQDLMGSAARTTEPTLGSEIPVMYHYLLRQDIEYFFRLGEIVGYEKERRTEDGQIDDSDPIYMYAKVVRKVPHRKKSMEFSRFDFKARYRIDIGEPRLVQVSVLDLYKFDRSGRELLSEQMQLSDSLEMAVFAGDPSEIRRRTTTRNERLEKARKEIKETLWEAWKLPENERRKVIKRLFLRWHPDKNIGCDIAKDVMQFLLSEIDRMEKLFPSSWRDNLREASEMATNDGTKGFHDFFNQWNQRARQERQTYNTFKRQAHQGTSYTKRSTKPQRNEAKRWLRQAREDLTAAKHLHIQEAEFPALVCFLCQQATEKCFKGALYAACGIAERQLETHDVLNLAYEITELDGSPEDIPLLAAKLKNYYEQTRYPHFHRGEAIPCNAFSTEQAQEALEVTESIQTRIEEFIRDKFA